MIVSMRTLHAMALGIAINFEERNRHGHLLRQQVLLPKQLYVNMVRVYMHWAGISI